MSKVNTFLIAAIDAEYGLGKDGDLLYHYKEDMQRFAALTRNSIVLMGRKTFESLPPGGLKGRTHAIVTSRDMADIKFPKDFKEAVTVCDTFEGALTAARALVLSDWDKAESIAIIGGAEIYKAGMAYCDTAYITRVFGPVIKADTYFPGHEFNKRFGCNACDFKWVSVDVEGVELTFETYKVPNVNPGAYRYIREIGDVIEIDGLRLCPNTMNYYIEGGILIITIGSKQFRPDVPAIEAMHELDIYLANKKEASHSRPKQALVA